MKMNELEKILLKQINENLHEKYYNKNETLGFRVNGELKKNIHRYLTERGLTLRGFFLNSLAEKLSCSETENAI